MKMMITKIKIKIQTKTNSKLIINHKSYNQTMFKLVKTRFYNKIQITIVLAIKTIK